MCIQVETYYGEGPDKAERLETVARILTEGVYTYLKKRGLLAAHRAQVAEKDAPEDHEPGNEDSP